MKCPYCGGEVTNGIGVSLKALPLSFKKRRILETVYQAGPDGISKAALMEMFFHGKKDVTVRTTMYTINNKLKRLKLRVASHEGVLRIEPR